MYLRMEIILAGVDLAWQSEKNPSAISCGNLEERVLTVSKIESAVWGIDSIFERLKDVKGLLGVSIDAPLIIKNESGQRICEKDISRVYGSRYAGAYPSNTKLYPNAKGVYLSKRLLEAGFNHLKGKRWQIECYPHPAIICNGQVKSDTQFRLCCLQ